jgi:hypothetical protein
MISTNALLGAIKEHGGSLTAPDIAELFKVSLEAARWALRGLLLSGDVHQEMVAGVVWYQTAAPAKVSPADRQAISEAVDLEGPVSERDATKLLRKSWLACHKILQFMVEKGDLTEWKATVDLTLYGRAA